MSWRRTRRPRTVVEPRPEPTAEEAVLAACKACDKAAAALAEALAARRAALVRLAAQTAVPGSSIVMRLFTSGSTWPALSHHGVGQLCGLPAVAPLHRRSFAQMAKAAIDSTHASRRPTPAAPNLEEEIHHAQAV